MEEEELRVGVQEAGDDPAETPTELPDGGPSSGSAEPEVPAVKEEPAGQAAAAGENLPAEFVAGGQSTAAVEVSAALALEQQLRQIQALDPAVRGWEEILSGPRAEEFTRLVRQGCTPAQAFQATQFDAIVARRVAAARRGALHAAYGKAHLLASSPAPGEDAAVPHDVRQQYRAFFPDWSEAQIKADYRRRKTW